MSDEAHNNRLPDAKASTTTRIFNAVPPTEYRLEILQLAARLLWEEAGSEPPPLESQRDILAALGHFIPTLSTSDPLPFEIRTALKEAETAIVPSNRYQASPPYTGQNGFSLTPILAESLAERERRDKTVVCGGIKMPRNPELPYDVLYPHMWVGSTCFLDWSTRSNSLWSNLSVPDHMSLKKRLYLGQMELWFELRPPESTVDNLSYPLVRMFNNVIQLLLEMYLLMIPCAGSPSTATAAFALCLEERRHSSVGLDYFEDLKKARAAKNNTESFFRRPGPRK